MRVEKGGSIVYSGEGIFKCEWVAWWSGVEWSGKRALNGRVWSTDDDFMTPCCWLAAIIVLIHHNRVDRKTITHICSIFIAFVTLEFRIEFK